MSAERQISILILSSAFLIEDAHAFPSIIRMKEGFRESGLARRIQPHFSTERELPRLEVGRNYSASDLVNIYAPYVDQMANRFAINYKFKRVLQRDFENAYSSCAEGLMCASRSWENTNKIPETADGFIRYWYTSSKSKLIAEYFPDYKYTEAFRAKRREYAARRLEQKGDQIRSYSRQRDAKIRMAKLLNQKDEIKSEYLRRHKILETFKRAGPIKAAKKFKIHPKQIYRWSAAVEAHGPIGVLPSHWRNAAREFLEVY